MCVYWGDVCLLGGCTWSRGVSILGGYLVPGVSTLGGVYSWGCVSAPGGSAPGGCSCPGTPPLWTEFLTHAYENITLPQTSFAGGKNCRHISCSLGRFWLNTDRGRWREWDWHNRKQLPRCHAEIHTFFLVIVLVPMPFPCSVNISLEPLLAERNRHLNLNYVNK